MLSFPAAINVYLCTVPCDMRRSFDGLSMMAEHVIGCNPYAGHLLVFSNRRTDRVKILYWGVSRTRAKARDAVPKMGVGLSESTCRSGLQTARCCCAQKAWW